MRVWRRNLFVDAVTRVQCTKVKPAQRSVPELVAVLGSQRAGDVSHIPGGRLPFLSARPVIPAPLRGLLPVLLLGEQRHDGCEQFAQDSVAAAI